ncbi:MAG: hypothetical protein ACEPOW_13695 [Bacteroidales bacterium]
MKKWLNGIIVVIVVILAFTVVNKVFNANIPDFSVGWVSCAVFIIFTKADKLWN